MKKELKNLPSIENYLSRKEWEIACWKKIVKSETLLKLLVTPHERHNLVMRAVALQGLISKKSYKQISEELWLSPQTISSIRKSILEKTYRSYFERSKKERKEKKYSPNSSSYKPTKGLLRKTKYGKVYIP